MQLYIVEWSLIYYSSTAYAYELIIVNIVTLIGLELER